ncbi:hypothetical protein RB593_001322 [Gaeumannomyces tritici]
MEKAGLRDSGSDSLPPPLAWQQHRRGRAGVRRSRAVRLLVLGCVVFIAYAQWQQVRGGSDANHGRLSADRLRADVETCARLRRKPQDPAGPGRERNARHVDGARPTLIRNATVWVGEAVEGTSAEDARRGKGYEWLAGTDVLLEFGLIREVRPGGGIPASSLPEGTVVYDAGGRQLTAGIVDMHSHAGVDQLPSMEGNDDTNEMAADITPYVRSIDGIKPYDPQIRVIKSGGVTTSLVLPGSANNIGGEAYVIKHAAGARDGRPELSAADMLADPDRNWRYMKMACGENAKRVYGRPGERGPTSRLGESWEFRHAFEQAAELNRRQDDWCAEAEAAGPERMRTYLPQELRWEALGAVLRGHVHVNTHCYTVPDLEAFIDHTNEFKFPVRAFHHAHQTFLVPEILKRVYGGVYPASALFADNMWYKDEAYIGSEFAGKSLYKDGLDVVYVSDNPVLNAQHVLFEAARAYGYGLPYHAALSSVTSTPAWYLGLGERIGKIKAGFDADVVVWDSDPLSVGATPSQVWIDGVAQFEDPVELEKPLKGPISPDLSLSETPEAEVKAKNVIFTGITSVTLSGSRGDDSSSEETLAEPVNMIVSDGRVTCVGPCVAELAQAAAFKTVKLRSGHVTDGFTAFGSGLGLNAIDAEDSTDNGDNKQAFTRAIDGLALDDKKLRTAHAYGVTRAISAPRLAGAMTHHGTSAVFLTGAEHSLAPGAVSVDDAAAHYTLSWSARNGKASSASEAVGNLRAALFGAVDALDSTAVASVADAFAEKMFLAKVVRGEMPLVLTAQSADSIAAILRVKADVEKALAASSSDGSSSKKLKVAIIGGAESHLVAAELARADVGVVLAPFESFCAEWEQRRCLTGAPLTNGTAVDALISAGVTVAVGLEEDWRVRMLGLQAGIARRNSGGRIGRRDALALVSANVYKMLGIDTGSQGGASHFVVWEGDPLEVGARVRAVGGGLGVTTVME